jgi:hypothetical protein
MDGLEVLARMLPIIGIAWWIIIREASTSQASSRPRIDRGSTGTTGSFQLPPRRRLGRRRFRGEMVEFRPAHTPVELPDSIVRAHPLWDRWLDG